MAMPEVSEITGVTSELATPQKLPITSIGRTEDLDLQAAECATDRKLLTCHRLAAATGAVVDALSEAGSGLQRLLSNGGGDSGVGPLDSLLAEEDPLVQRATNGLLAACNGISVALIGLAAALTGEVQRPLEDLHRAVDADRAKWKTELAGLKQQHQICADALESSLRRKERLTAHLVQLTVQCQNWQENCTQKLPWQRNTGLQKQEMELKLQQVASLQTIAMEEFATHMDKVMAVSEKTQSGMQVFGEVLKYVDYALKEILHVSLGHCANAWEHMAGSLNSMAGQLRDSAKDVKPTQMPPSSIPRAAWANIGAVLQAPNGAPHGGGFTGTASKASPSRGTDLSGWADPASRVSPVATGGSEDSFFPANTSETAWPNSLALGLNVVGTAHAVKSDPLGGMNNDRNHSMTACQEPHTMNETRETCERQGVQETYTAYEAQEIDSGDADDSLDVDHEKALLLSAICGLREAAEQAVRRAETAEVALAAQGVEVPMGIEAAAAVAVQ